MTLPPLHPIPTLTAQPKLQYAGTWGLQYQALFQIPNGVGVVGRSERSKKSSPVCRFRLRGWRANKSTAQSGPRPPTPVLDALCHIHETVCRRM